MRGLVPGDVIAGYTVVRVLGSGGMGTVYLAQHPRLPRHQALKVLASALGADPSFRERFRREAELASRLDHPNIVSVQDAGVDEDLMWIAMQYVDGTDTAAMVRDAHGPLHPALIIDIIGQVASALDYAHAQGTLHRDVKPANILTTAGHSPGTRRALIGDFGVARLLSESTGLTGTGTMIGTLAYAAPELFSGEPLTPAVDVYALGCTFYELLTGAPVFPRSDQLAMMSAHLHAPVPRLTDSRPDLPSAFDDVIYRALAKRPQDRFATCGELAAAASAALYENPARTGSGRTVAGPTVMAPTPQPPQPHSMPDHQPTVSAQAFPRRSGRPATAAGSTPGISGPHPAQLNPVPARRGAVGWITAAIVGVVVLAVVAISAILLVGKGDTATPVAGQVSETPVAERTPEPSSSDTSPSAGASPPTTPANLIGTWRGAVTGDQTGFDVVADISSEYPVRATVSYPQIGCSGTWTEQLPRRGGIIVNENITRGTCVTSQISLTPGSDGTLRYSSTYFSRSQNRDFVITATLRRG
ncbi:protein kinase [Gordonia sp. zg691]|uniref:serine/threonine-protein kinase n=1 Tax=Gordonia jinghuaiqii TaxID=2758710 RepID=UPI0016626F5B|nr:serine/threonine-protein kinase [Gordonia jinghuaiqii]MBD0862891.1 protein kinase [Gordonia jinghuaiqii]